MRTMQQALLALGVAATFLSLVFLCGGWARREPAAAILELALPLAGFATWALSPYGALHYLQRLPSPTLAQRIVVLAASALIAMPAVLVYLPAFVFAPRPRPTASAVALIFTPLYQWLFASVAWALWTVLPGLLARYSRK